MIESDVGPGLLARALLTLGRRSASGDLGVEAAGGRRARVSLSRGRITRIDHASGGAFVLGDLLASDGLVLPQLAIDESGRSGREPIGRYLVREGRASHGAVEHALRKQTRLRLRTLFGWERPRLGFREGDDSPPDVSVPVGEAVLDALRSLALREDGAELLANWGEQQLALTGFGRELLRGAPLRPEEAAVASLLERSVRIASLAATVAEDGRALRFTAMLRRIGAAEPVTATGSYSLLLRKRQELRRTADPRTLLGLSATASPDEARRALRRLARDLHPDRFASADVGTRALSAEVLKALVRAEAQIASAGTPSPRGRAK